MMFVNSLKLFGSNWVKVLKFLLYYVVILGISFALFLPVFFEFKEILSACHDTAVSTNSFNGVFQGALGQNLHSLIYTSWALIVTAFSQNIGMAIYGIIVLAFFLPFLANVGKYTFYEMMYSYMTSKNEKGFFSAFAESLKKSVVFALVRTFYNMFFLCIALLTIYALGMISNPIFITYALPFVVFIVLVAFFSLNQNMVLGWAPAMIVFDCNVFVGFRKGVKAVKRHFWSILGTTTLYFVLFWLICLLFGVYPLVAIAPVMTVLLCVYNMVVFFTSQGMRFYVNGKHILTPKKLEEVDNINKTAYIL